MKMIIFIINGYIWNMKTAKNKQMNKNVIISALIMIIIITSGCYSFKAISIPEYVKSFYISDLDNRAPNAPATIDITFREGLEEKILRETSLYNADTDPDIIFTGSIISYKIRNEAPQPGESIALNKLEIAVEVQYEDAKDEENDWKQRFSYFVTYDADQNLNDIQDELVEQIFEQLTDQVFNRAFSNW